MDELSRRALEFHAASNGKLAVISKVALNNRDDLNLAYTPGVAAPCREIAADPESVYRYTMKGNMVAVITDGSAVLGLGDIGPAASLPVMEGKCLLFKRFAGVDAFPVCIGTQDVDEFVKTVKLIASSFGGINLEDISAPRCFEIEKRLKAELDIPVMHDDQHGTAITVLGALINALKVVEKKIGDVKIVLSGAGAAGTAVAKLLVLYGARHVVVCDRQGALHRKRAGIDETPFKRELAMLTNQECEDGTLGDVMKGADVFIGVSQKGLVNKAMVASMAAKAIVFAMANPEPEIMPDEALAGGAAIVGTGRSDFPNQINNALAFPGVFRGLLDARARNITEDMQIAAAKALAAFVVAPHKDHIVPNMFDEGLSSAIARALVASVPPPA